MHAAWHHRPSSVVGLSAPPVTGHRQHCGGGLSSSCSSIVAYQALNAQLMLRCSFSSRAVHTIIMLTRPFFPVRVPSAAPCCCTTEEHGMQDHGPQNSHAGSFS